MATPITIADAAVAVAADLRQYDADLKKAEASGTASGSRLAAALKKDFGRAVAGGATLMFAAATKGALQLADAAARIRAETGAGAEEAHAAAKTINLVAGSEMMAFEAVEDIALRVRRDMGLAGKAADDMTARMAKFARVTRQDGATAVADFDDIIDRWNLNASDTAEIQNVLIAGWQQWGGDIAANQQALAKLAPQLQAMNMTWQDGAALINLFNAAGVDAEGQTRALTTAFKNLKAGETLPGVIAELSAIEDPAKRAGRAIEIFGQRGGQELATALGPGVGLLSDYAENVDGLPDKVDGMANDLDSTWTGRLKKFFSEANAAVKDFGFNLGEAGVAAATFASLIATLGGGKLAKGLAAALLTPFIGIGKMIGTAIWLELAGAGVLDAMRPATTKIGNFFGSTLGKVAAVAFAAVLWLEVINTYNRIKGELNEQLKQIGTDVGNEVKTGTVEALEGSKAALEKGIADLGGVWDLGIFSNDARAKLQAELDAVNAELERRAEEGGALVGAAYGTGLRASGTGPSSFSAAAATMAQELPLELLEAGKATREAAALLPSAIAAGIRERRDAALSAFRGLVELLKHPMSRAKELGRLIGFATSKELARALRSNDPEIKAAAQSAQATWLAEIEELVREGGKPGKRAMEELEKAMKSKDPALRALARATKAAIDTDLTAKTGPKTPGEAIADQLAADLGGKKGLLGRTAYDMGLTIARNILAGVRGTGLVVPNGSSAPAGSRFEGKSLPSFDVGTSYVPHDMLALVHKGEIIHSPEESDRIRKGIGVGGPMVTIGSIDARGHDDPWAVGRAVKAEVGDLLADILRDQSVRGPISPR